MFSARELKARLRQGGSTIGSWMQIPDTAVAEIMGRSGYDWVAVDLEHGAFSPGLLPDLFRAIELGGTLPFARVARVDFKDIKAALDSGARGLIYPMIHSREELDRAVDWASYPPEGSRGVGYSRASLYGKAFDEYRLGPAKEIFHAAIIEHEKALPELEAIMGHPELDAVMVGPYDLSASMGLTGRFDHPDFAAALERIRRVAEETKTPMGLHVVQPDPAQAEQRIKERYQFIAYGIDAVFLYNAAQAPQTKGADNA